MALFHDGRLIAGHYNVLGRGHAERLVPMIADLPGKGRAQRIIVSKGPGSFTGVRIGIAAAQALGLAWQAEVLAYPTLALVAAMAQADRLREPVTVCMNGGHGEWFVQDFGIDGLAQGPPASLPPGAAAARSRHACIAGNKAEDLAALLPEKALHTVTLLPDARRALQLSAALLSADLTPAYGRSPDAQPSASKSVAERT